MFIITTFQGNPVRFSIILVTIENAVGEKDEQDLLFCIAIHYLVLYWITTVEKGEILHLYQINWSGQGVCPVCVAFQVGGKLKLKGGEQKGKL